MSTWEPTEYAEHWADRYDEWFSWLTDTDLTVKTLADLAGEGPVLELGVGTGRLAIPLARRGLSVHGIEASERMVKLLRAKEDGSLIDITVGDFARFDLKEQFSLIFLSCNTLFSLPFQEQQTSCMQHAARHLKNGGVVVIEASVPDVESYTDGSLLRALRVDCDSVILMAVGHDSVSQQTLMQQIVLTESGIQLGPVRHRYIWPSELDLMARLSGLRLRTRWSGWERGPFTTTSTGHVSIYEQAE